ncbi:L,D-transpeptidase family protein [Clostridium sp.]|uniref:L,D-transpeptidase n=1 Tax=Clostridium sp. TaxID=1506 RepID=UPI001A3AFBC1|nr:L,D-transpeptidase family protein [Clostridium sp.]MBK5235238.1 L,D-transpeptidase [Clostridium sp.]
MLKKNVFNLVIAFILIACSWLYNDYLSNSIDSSHNIEISKIDFIAFPNKENKYKISPLIKEFTSNIAKNTTDSTKQLNTKQEILETPMFRAGSNTICNYYTRFYGNYLFHTVLLDNNENIQDGRLGTPLSHGCIRLAIDDAKYIYTTVPYGTFVSIQ